MISKEEYHNLKEYYDHQRLRVYNKEKVYDEIKEFLDRVEKMTKEEGEANKLENSIDTMFEKAWAEMEEDFIKFALHQEVTPTHQTS